MAVLAEQTDPGQRRWVPGCWHAGLTGLALFLVSPPVPSETQTGGSSSSVSQQLLTFLVEVTRMDGFL